MPKKQKQPAWPSPWQVQNLQLITFTSDPQLEIEHSWWHDVMGIERESRSDRKGERKEEGVIDGMSITLSIDSSRLLWLFSPKPTEDDSDHPPVLGPIKESLERFSQIMHSWLMISPAMKRIAIAGTLLQRVKDKDEGYATLNQYLHNMQVENDSTDFLYRINRPSMVTTADGPLKINRLTTWAFVTFTALHTKIGPSIQNPKMQVIKESNACILEIDVNTAPENELDGLSPAGRVDVFDRLLETSIQISEQGIPGNG